MKPDWKIEVGRRNAEVGRLKSEVGRLKAEVGMRKWEGWNRCALSLNEYLEFGPPRRNT